MFDIFSRNRGKEPLEVVVRLAYMAEIKEWDCRPHIERIRRYTFIIGSGLGISQQDNEMISIASQLHDLGKALIPDRLLNKVERYDETERKLIEGHTLEGQKILDGSSSPVLQIAATIALTHHERWDGSGYPNHLKGPEIPMGGRVCALADVFDALTTSRSYKQTVSPEEALKLITDSSGVLFDPMLVKIFRDRFEDIRRAKQSAG